MRLGSKKIIYIRKSKESKRRFFAFLIMLLMLLFLGLASSYFFETVRPAMITLAKTKGKQLALKSINSAVSDIFSNDNISYKDIIVLEKNSEGDVKAAQSNLEGINKLKALLSTKIQENIEKDDTVTVSLPLGTLLGTDFFAGVGPKFDVSFVPYGITKVDFTSDFSDSGINQTRLVINLEVETTVGLLMPTVNTNVDVKTTVPVIQTIIVGDVPESYTNVEREGEAYEDDVLELKD